MHMCNIYIVWIYTGSLLTYALFGDMLYAGLLDLFDHLVVLAVGLC